MPAAAFAPLASSPKGVELRRMQPRAAPGETVALHGSAPRGSVCWGSEWMAGPVPAAGRVWVQAAGPGRHPITVSYGGRLMGDPDSGAYDRASFPGARRRAGAARGRVGVCSGAGRGRAAPVLYGCINAPMPARSSRSDTSARERLLDAGLALARRSGLRALTVRGVATAAEANLGSFVHHFGSRDAFVAELIERWYAPLFARLELTAHGGVTGRPRAVERLRSVLLQLVRWLVDNRDFVAHLLLDAGAGEAAARRFLRTVDRRHPALLLELIAQAQAARQLRRGEPLHLLLFLMGTLAAPVLLLHLLSARGGAPPPLVQSLAAFATDGAHIEQRLDWALRGLQPDRGAAR
jgi:AcrR family transcriptional regulator